MSDTDSETVKIEYIDLPELTDDFMQRLKGAALNALPQAERSQGEECDAMFAFKLLLTPEIVLAMIAQQSN